MNMIARRSNTKKLIMIGIVVLIATAAYLLVEVNFGNPKLFQYAMNLRVPKLLAMFIAAFAIGGASIVFQSIINNTIVTPCLVGNEFFVYLDPYCGGFLRRLRQHLELPMQTYRLRWTLLIDGCGGYCHL